MIEHITVQFSTTTSTTWQQKWENRASLLIRAILHGSPFSHCGFVLDNGDIIDATDSPDAPIRITTPEGNPRGVAVRPHNYQEWGTRRRMILRTDRADAIIAAAMSQVGKPFDGKAVTFKSFVDTNSYPRVKDWRDPSSWFCAELVVWCEETGGFWDPRLIYPKQRVSPVDVLLLHVTDPRFVNRDMFWEPVPGLTLGRYEM